MVACRYGISVLVFDSTSHSFTAKLKLRSLFHYEQIVRENSDIKRMKVPSFSLTVTKYLTFQLSGYFL